MHTRCAVDHKITATLYGHRGLCLTGDMDRERRSVDDHNIQNGQWRNWYHPWQIRRVVIKQHGPKNVRPLNHLSVKNRKLREITEEHYKIFEVKGKNIHSILAQVIS